MPFAAPPSLSLGPDIYRSIGVRPVINCTGIQSMVSGSQTLPEVKRAMYEASRHYVHMDELMEAVGKRLAELTGAEWGIVTAGSAAALTHATAACVTGGDPEKIQRVPNLTGLKNEVIVPRYSRNIYDHAVRMLGVRMVEVGSQEELVSAFNPRTAMVMVLAGPAADSGPLGLALVTEVARQKGVPVLVDAASERLLVPNVHLERGATMVAYSAGKCMRGPQCAGLLLGRKDLVQAAWINSAPHHAFGRPMKVGKEEIMGALAAVEVWRRRDHKAEWKEWVSWAEFISRRVTQVKGVTTEIVEGTGLSFHSPQLRIDWDGARLGIAGQEVEQALLEGNPRITLNRATGNRREGMASSVNLVIYTLMPGEERIVADRLYVVLSRPPRVEAPARPSGQPADVAGQWEAKLEFFNGRADHTLLFEQQGTALTGTHTGDVLKGDLHGTIEGHEIHFRSSHRIEGAQLSYDFAGKVEATTMQGTVGLGEYGKARWTAQRHRYPA